MREFEIGVDRPSESNGKSAKGEGVVVPEIPETGIDPVGDPSEYV